MGNLCIYIYAKSKKLVNAHYRATLKMLFIFVLHNELHSDRFNNAMNKQCTEMSAIYNFQVQINFQFQPKLFWRVKNSDQNSDV